MFMDDFIENNNFKFIKLDLTKLKNNNDLFKILTLFIIFQLMLILGEV